MATIDSKIPSEPQEGPISPVLRQVHLTDIIEIFRDPEEETASEGYARVWEILDEDEMFYTLVISYMKDPAAPDRKFVRKYRKYQK